MPKYAIFYDFIIENLREKGYYIGALAVIWEIAGTRIPVELCDNQGTHMERVIRKD